MASDSRPNNERASTGDASSPVCSFLARNASCCSTERESSARWRFRITCTSPRWRSAGGILAADWRKSSGRLRRAGVTMSRAKSLDGGKSASSSAAAAIRTSVVGVFVSERTTSSSPFGVSQRSSAMRANRSRSLPPRRRPQASNVSATASRVRRMSPFRISSPTFKAPGFVDATLQHLQDPHRSCQSGRQHCDDQLVCASLSKSDSQSKGYLKTGSSGLEGRCACAMGF